MVPRINYDMIAELVRKRDRFALKRAETLVQGYLHRCYLHPFDWADMAEAYTWLGSIEWVRKDYESTLHYLANAGEIYSFLQDNKASTRTHLGMAACYVKLKRNDEAIDAVVLANNVSDGLGVEFKEYVQTEANHIFQAINESKRES